MTALTVSDVLDKAASRIEWSTELFTVRTLSVVDAITVAAQSEARVTELYEGAILALSRHLGGPDSNRCNPVRFLDTWDSDGRTKAEVVDALRQTAAGWLAA